MLLSMVVVGVSYQEPRLLWRKKNSLSRISFPIAVRLTHRPLKVWICSLRVLSSFLQKHVTCSLKCEFMFFWIFCIYILEYDLNRMSCVKANIKAKCFFRECSNYPSMKNMIHLVVTQFWTPSAGDDVCPFWIECRSVAHVC